MKTKQPKWILIGQLGDENPVEHGGYFIYQDTTGVYAPEAELLEVFDDEKKLKLSRFILEPCTYLNGILSDNSYHPEHPAWFNDSLSAMAEFVGMKVDELIQLFISDDPCQRAVAWRVVADYHGVVELDEDAVMISKFTASAKYRRWKLTLHKVPKHF